MKGISMKGRSQVFGWFLLKRGLAPWVAKVIRLILIDKTRRSLLRIHRHFTDGVDSYQGVGRPKARLYDMGYHRSEGLFCREPLGDDGCNHKAQSETGKAKKDARRRFTKGQSQIGC